MLEGVELNPGDAEEEARKEGLIREVEKGSGTGSGVVQKDV